MDKFEIIDLDGRKIEVYGIYFISNNNYYFIYTKEEVDNEGHTILYIVKVLQEVANTQMGPQSTGYLIGTKISDDNEYKLLQQDIVNIINEKGQGTRSAVRYLEVSMLRNLKISDYRIFKLDNDIYNNTFKRVQEELTPVIPTSLPNVDYQVKYEEQVKINKQLQVELNNLNNKLQKITEILNIN